MKINLTYRFFLSILIATSLTATGFILVACWHLDREFLSFIRESERESCCHLAAILEEYYGATSSWEPLIENREPRHRPSFAAQRETSGRALNAFQPEKRSLPPHAMAALSHRFALLDQHKEGLVGALPPDENMELTPLVHKSQTVGFLALKPTQQLTEVRHLDFLRSQYQFFTGFGIFIVLAVASFSLWQIRRLMQPINELAQATHKLTSGEFSNRIPVTPNNELGQLANDFNMLALTLEKNEQSRRQWIADISHELRTPIGILRGEIEALMDGVRQADDKAFESLHAETMRLGRLVCDLYQLSMSDLGALSYRKKIINATALLHDVIDSYKDEIQNRQVRFLGMASPKRPIYVFADPERLHQLFSNVLDNSLKYTDPGGYLKIVTSKGRENLEINIQDSAPSIPETALDKIFNRFFRIESSRNRETGGAGLGLAICRNIIEAHQGFIRAEQSPLGGLWIKISLPHMRKTHV